MSKLAVLAMLTMAAAPAQSMYTLLRHSDVGEFVPLTCRVHLSMRQDVPAATNNEPGAVSEAELWRSGADRTLVRFLDPKERGKYLLRLGADLWFIAPGAKNPVHLSPTHRVYGAATVDVLLGMHLAEDYRIAGTSRVSSPAGGEVVFDLQAKSEQQQFASVRYTVDVTTERPVSALYRLKSGRDATLIEFFDWLGGAHGGYAKRVEVRDLLRKGAITKIEVVAFEERSVPEGLFDLKDPSARRALERGGG